MVAKRNQLDVLFCLFSIAIYPLSTILAHFTIPKIIFVFYALVLIFQLYIFYKYPLSSWRILILIGLYLLYGLFFMTANSQVRYKFMRVDMLMIYIYYLPTFVLIFSRITDFSFLFKHRKVALLTDFLIIASFLIKYVLKDQTNYMVYSYQLLPFWILFIERFVRKQSLYHCFILFICLLEGIIYGARAPLLWLFIAGVAFSILFLIYEVKKAETYLIILGKLTLIVSLFIININFLSQWITKIDFGSSYILNRLNKGLLTESSGRDMIRETFFQYVQTMGIDINGLFYDRLMMPAGMYSHNIIYETMISFGWIFGPIILISLAIFIIYTFFISDYHGKVVWVFGTCTYFLKYFISGSIYEDYGFLLYMTILTCLIQHSRSQKVTAQSRDIKKQA